MRKNSTKTRSMLRSSTLENKTKSTQALTQLIRHRSSILEAAKKKTDNAEYQPLPQFEENTPATNKLVALLNKKKDEDNQEPAEVKIEAGNINFSSKLPEDQQIEEEN